MLVELCVEEPGVSQMATNERWRKEADAVDLTVGTELERAVCFGNPDLRGRVGRRSAGR
jgi:hypothetical protein